MSFPTGASSANTSSPAWSSDRPSSRAEHSMPWLSTPRIFAALISKGWPFSPCSLAPTSAQGTFWPAATLGAPHTMLSIWPVPASTLHSDSRSALGWLSFSSTLATTTPENGGATGWQSSTSSPDMVSRCDSSSVEMGGSTSVRSQRSENCIFFGLVELAQKAQVAVKEQAQIIDAIAQHGQSLETRAEGEANVALRIKSVIAYDSRMHLPCPRNLQPSSFQWPGLESHVDFCRRFGKRKERRPEPYLQIVAFKKAPQEIRVHPFKIGEADVLVDPQPLDLVEHGRVGGVRVHTVGAPRHDDLDGRR